MANLSVATPPWLNVQPTDFSGALLKGFQTGLSLADMKNQIAEANAQRADAEQKQADANALAVWEREQQMALEQQKLAQEAETERAQIDALAEYRQGSLENQRLEATRPINVDGVLYGQDPKTGKYTALTQEQNKPLNVGGVLFTKNPLTGQYEPSTQKQSRAMNVGGTLYEQDANGNWAAKTPLKQGETPQQVDARKLRLQEANSLNDQLAAAQKAAINSDTDPAVRGMLLTNTIPALKAQYAQTASGITNTPVASPAAATLPLPQTQKELIPGRFYQTSRGVARWDGTNFVKE